NARDRRRRSAPAGTRCVKRDTTDSENAYQTNSRTGRDQSVPRRIALRRFFGNPARCFFGFVGCFVTAISGCRRVRCRRITALLRFFLVDLDRDRTRTAEHYLVAVLEQHFTLIPHA